MPTILPISDLRNYTAVLERVDVGQPVYLTRNGRGTYVITRLDDYDRQATVEELVREIEQGERSAQDNKPRPIDEVAERLGVQL